MNYLILIISFVYGFSNQPSDVNLNPKTLKTIDKEINKTWKGLTITRSPLFTGNKNTENRQMKTGKSFVLLNNTDTVAYLFVRRTNGCVIGGCSNSSVSEIDKPKTNNFAERYEHFDYMIILNKNLSVKKVKVLVYEGDYGYEITSKLWLKQFIGYQGENLSYGSDIQAISGATVSAQSITNDIELAVQTAKELRAQGIL